MVQDGTRQRAAALLDGIVNALSAEANEAVDDDVSAMLVFLMVDVLYALERLAAKA